MIAGQTLRVYPKGKPVPAFRIMLRFEPSLYTERRKKAGKDCRTMANMPVKRGEIEVKVPRDDQPGADPSD
jgi:hypothetical protein